MVIVVGRDVHVDVPGTCTAGDRGYAPDPTSEFGTLFSVHEAIAWEGRPQLNWPPATSRASRISWASKGDTLAVGLLIFWDLWGAPLDVPFGQLAIE